MKIISKLRQTPLTTILDLDNRWIFLRGFRLFYCFGTRIQLQTNTCACTNMLIFSSCSDRFKPQVMGHIHPGPHILSYSNFTTLLVHFITYESIACVYIVDFCIFFPVTNSCCDVTDVITKSGVIDNKIVLFLSTNTLAHQVRVSLGAWGSVEKAQIFYG